jgi:drug/metabolite transporter (DMT)-like permease
MATAPAFDDRIVPVPRASTRVPSRVGQGGRAGQGAGLALGLVSAMSFGTSGTFGSALLGSGWSPAGAVLARAGIAAAALTVPALLALRGRWALLRRSWWRVVSYGLVGVAASQICYFNAIARMDVGISILLEYLGVILVVGWLWARHGQQPRLLTVLGGVAALGGLALMLDLSGADGVNVTGVIWALAAAVAAAVYFFQAAAQSDGGSDRSSEHSGERSGKRSGDGRDPSNGDATLPPVVLAWGGMLAGGAAVALLGAARLLPLRVSGSPVTLLNARVSWLVPLLGVGLVAAAIAYVTGIGAARRLGAKLGSFVAMAEVLFAAGFAWVLLHQVPTGMQFIGGLLILAGVVAVRLDE